MYLLYRMEVQLNAYIKNVADKFLRPILKDHGCGLIIKIMTIMHFS